MNHSPTCFTTGKYVLAIKYVLCEGFVNINSESYNDLHSAETAARKYIESNFCAGDDVFILYISKKLRSTISIAEIND